MSNHAVLDDAFVYYHANGRTFRQAIKSEATPAFLLTLAERLDLQSLWVMPGSAISTHAAREGWLQPPDGWTLGQHPSYMLLPRGQGRALLAFSGWQPNGKTRVIMFPRIGDTWEIAEVSSPLMLLATLDYIEQALEIAPYWSAGDVGQRLMRRTNAGARYSRTAPADLSPFPELLAATRAPRPFTWYRPLSPDEAARPYLIGLDKNSAWPAACTNVELGIGQPQHVDSQAIDPAAPPTGCYRLARAEPPPTLPCPLPPLAEIAPEGWVWSPTLRTLHKLGYTLHLTDGYIWQDAKTILRRWAERIWKARQAIRSDPATYPHAEARELAQNAIKKIANVGMQWLDLQGKDFSNAHPYHRPDWYALIKDRARAAQLEQMVHFANKYGLAPVMIHVDALYYAVEFPEIEQSMPGILARSQGLGGYKNAFAHASLPLAPFVDLFASEGLKTATIHHALHTYDTEQQGV